MIAGLNLNNIVSGALQSVTPTRTVTLLAFKGQSNNRGRTTTSYDELKLQANIQSVSNKELNNLDAVTVKLNLLKMYICYDANTLSRALSTAGDLIVFDSIKYRIIKIDDQYLTGWVSCLCAETSEGDDE